MKPTSLRHRGTTEPSQTLPSTLHSHAQVPAPELEPLPYIGRVLRKSGGFSAQRRKWTE